jgi:hypothetical protein
MSKKRTVWKNTSEGKTVRRNTIAGQFCSRPREFLESPALRILSRAAHLALMRIELELRNHGGRDNGKLPVTEQNFVAFGIHQDAVAPALRELAALSIIRITVRGRGGNAEYRRPNRFLLNYLCGAVDTRNEITNKWKRIETMEQAEQIARVARAAKDPDKVAYGRRNYRSNRNISRALKPCLGPGTETMPETGNFPGTEDMPTAPGTETMPTIDISGRRVGARGGNSLNEREAPPAHAPIGHNAGPPLDDLSIPAFLRRTSLN